ncbi:hypothetical protein RRG08_003763 [Elysia crispata]|uniref:Uncharacterized protein n=1 Tax=Elysia crispata TaxID=231223 RepID=A0AAE1AVF8_9GAST|nr:hypothetical protein RRG08_003763 [Elysia crispata]
MSCNNHSPPFFSEIYRAGVWVVAPCNRCSVGVHLPGSGSTKLTIPDDLFSKFQPTIPPFCSFSMFRRFTEADISLVPLASVDCVRIAYTRTILEISGSAPDCVIPPLRLPQPCH